MVGGREVQDLVGGEVKGGVTVTKAVKILALPRRGGGSDPCQDLFGGFGIVLRSHLKVIMDPQE